MPVPKELETVKSGWAAFEPKSLPMGNRGVLCGGQPITIVQSEISGFVLTYIQTGGALGSRQRAALEAGLKNLEACMGELTDEGKVYFEELKALGEIVLQSCHDTPTL